MQLTFDDIAKIKGGGRYVRRISYADAKPFIMTIHYARRMPCVTDAFGLFEDGEMIGVVTFGQPASPSLCKGLAGEVNRKHVLELNRLVILPGHDGNNNASFLVGHALKMLPDYTFIVSYADWGGWGHVGYVYQATNFLYTGLTKARTDKFSEGHSRHYDKNETRRKPRSAKHRYVYLVGNRRDKKQMLRQLNYPVIEEYPKGDSRRYDTSNPVSLLDKD